MELKFKKLQEDAVLPSYANPNDAGLDLTAVSFTQEELNRGVTLTARADNNTYSVKWTLNEGTPVEGKTFTLPTDLKNDSKLFVEFTVDTKPEPETKHTLTVSSKDDSMGLIQYGENEKKSIDFSLEKKEKVTVKAVAKKGCRVESGWHRAYPQPEAGCHAENHYARQ